VTLAVDSVIARHHIDDIVAALTPLVTDERRARIEAVLDARISGLTVALENLHDPHNGAAAIRSVEAFGLTSLHVIETLEPFGFSDSVTIGCEKWISIERHADFTTCAQTLRGAGITTWAMVAREPGDEVCDIDQVDVSTPLALVFGNERDGLSDLAISGCDGRASLPMFGFTRSFNLSVSVALALQHLSARRRAHLGASGDIDERERARLRARWYVHSVRGANAVVDRYVSDLPRNGVGALPHSDGNG
jgi:tRNA (guanosine-2'-O-)-methyltransferase